MSDDRITSVTITVRTKDAGIIESDSLDYIDTRADLVATLRRLADEVETECDERGLLDEEAAEDTEPEPCKHCDDLIQRSDKAGGDYLHTTGHYAGKHNCATDRYGYHAEPVNTPCRADGPNPCRGSRGGERPQTSKAQDQADRAATDGR